MSIDAGGAKGVRKKSAVLWLFFGLPSLSIWIFWPTGQSGSMVKIWTLEKQPAGYYLEYWFEPDNFLPSPILFVALEIMLLGWMVWDRLWLWCIKMLFFQTNTNQTLPFGFQRKCLWCLCVFSRFSFSKRFRAFLPFYLESYIIWQRKAIPHIGRCRGGWWKKEEEGWRRVAAMMKCLSTWSRHMGVGADMQLLPRCQPACKLSQPEHISPHCSTMKDK